MISGFASLAGSVLGAYIKMGISAVDLLTASVISAPGSLAISKLIYPEMEESKYKNIKDKKVEKMDVANIDAVFYRTYPLLYYKFGNMLIFQSGNLYSLCSPVSQHYHKIVYFFFTFFVTKVRNRRSKFDNQ